MTSSFASTKGSAARSPAVAPGISVLTRTRMEDTRMIRSLKRRMLNWAKTLVSAWNAATRGRRKSFPHPARFPFPVVCREDMPENLIILMDRQSPIRLPYQTTAEALELLDKRVEEWKREAEASFWQDGQLWEALKAQEIHTLKMPRFKIPVRLRPPVPTADHPSSK